METINQNYRKSIQLFWEILIRYYFSIDKKTILLWHISIIIAHPDIATIKDRYYYIKGVGKYNYRFYQSEAKYLRNSIY